MGKKKDARADEWVTKIRHINPICSHVSSEEIWLGESVTQITVAFTTDKGMTHVMLDGEEAEDLAEALQIHARGNCQNCAEQIKEARDKAEKLIAE